MTAEKKDSLLVSTLIIQTRLTNINDPLFTYIYSSTQITKHPTEEARLYRIIGTATLALMK